MSFARTLIKLSSFQISGAADTIPYSSEAVPYDTEASAGTTVKAALDLIFAVLYPNTKSAVDTPADLPLVGNSINDYRLVLNDGDGKAAGYRWEQREGEASPSWHKTHDMDWSNDAILAAFMDQTMDLYVSKYGRRDLDASGNPITGTFAGQSIYGGTNPGENLTLNANAGDGTGPQSGYVQFNGDARPTGDDAFDLGTAFDRFRDLYISRYISDGTDAVTVAQIRDAYDHSHVTDENPHNTSYDQLATKLGTITVNGDASGSVDMSTSGNKTLTITIADDSHAHDALSTINNFDTAVYNELKLQLVDNGPLTWVFDDGLEEVTPTFNIDTADISNLADPAANSILVSNPTGDAWIASNGEIELTGDVTGVGTLNGTTGKWTLPTVVSSSHISGLGGVELENKSFTSIAGDPDTIIPAPAHGLQSGEKVRILGTTSLDGEHVVTSIDANSFSVPVVTAAPESGHYIPQGAQLLFNTTTGNFQIAKEFEEIRLGELSGLNEDVLDIYVAKGGRVGGQEIIGGLSAGESLVLESTANATKGTIQVKDKITPYTNANYSGGWSGTDLGSSARRWNDLYMAGEAKGLRAENVTSLPSPSGTEIGRLVYHNGTLYHNTGAAYEAVGAATGPTALVVKTETSNYTALTTDDVILCSNTITITLPPAASADRKLVIKNIGTEVITIVGYGSEQIDGSLVYDIYDQYHSVTLVSNGTGWFII